MIAVEQLLPALKLDLGISATTAYDDRLITYLQKAAAKIEDEGVDLTGSIADGELVVMYAAWQWRKRDSGDGMPRMLRLELNNRVFSRKMR